MALDESLKVSIADALNEQDVVKFTVQTKVPNSILVFRLTSFRRPLSASRRRTFRSPASTMSLSGCTTGSRSRRSTPASLYAPAFIILSYEPAHYTWLVCLEQSRDQRAVAALQRPYSHARSPRAHPSRTSHSHTASWRSCSMVCFGLALLAFYSCPACTCVGVTRCRRRVHSAG